MMKITKEWLEDLGFIFIPKNKLGDIVVRFSCEEDDMFDHMRCYVWYWVDKEEKNETWDEPHIKINIGGDWWAAYTTDKFLKMWWYLGVIRGKYNKELID